MGIIGILALIKKVTLLWLFVTLGERVLFR